MTRKGNGSKFMKRMSEEKDGLDCQVLTADGFEDAFLGIGAQFNKLIAVYSYAKCLEILQDRDGMSQARAEEYFSFNVQGSDVGDHTPVFPYLDTGQVETRDD